MTASFQPPPGLVFDPAALQTKSLELLDVTDKDPRRAAERRAAAEAHLRLVVGGSARERATRLLDRARGLDPYRAETYFLLALESMKSGAWESAIELLDHAVMLAPKDLRARLHRGYALLEAAKQSASTDLADAAREDFEAILFVDPSHVPAQIGAIEASICGKAKRLRETLAQVFARVTPSRDLARTMTRLLYQAIFAFGVGKAKNVDAQNKKTMAEIVEVARRWLEVARGDPMLGGVIAAASAKCETAEEICAHLPSLVRDVPDVRIVRLLVRERLAEVAEPSKRLELFEGAMEKIPPLDGIAQDYLQLLHLVAKRAAAEGDVAAARAAWQKCASKDPDNVGVVHNLLRLAEHAGNAKEIATLRARLAELVGIYAEHSPRADRVLARAAARFTADYDAQSSLVVAEAQREGKGPSVAMLEELATRLVRADALTRLALEAELRSKVPAATVRRLVDPETPSARLVAEGLTILGAPLAIEAPVAYAYLDIGKDASHDAVQTAREKYRERWMERIESREIGKRLSDHFRALLERAEATSAVLLDPHRRAEYDRRTASADLASFYRRHSEAVLDLYKLAREASDDDVPRRVDLANKLLRLKDPIVDAHLTTTERDEAWLKRAGADVAWSSILKKGYEAINEGKPEVAVDLAGPYVAPGERYFRLQRLFSRAILEDPRGSLAQGVELARKHARLALACVEPGDPDEVVDEMNAIANEPDAMLFQRAAAERSRNCLARGQTAAALAVLWQGHPRATNAMPGGVFPTGLAWQSMEPMGRALYAWCVAQALRANTIDWYNAQRPTSHWELGNQKMAALKVARVCDRWMTYAGRALDNETLPQGLVAQIRDALANLAAALERDRRNLSG